MADSADTLRKKSNEVLRELAVHQGAAYRSYGEALARYGDGDLTAAELLREAGDLYYKEAGRVASSLFSAYTGLITAGLDVAGVKISDKEESADPKIAVPPLPETKKS